jgi:site-specific DNA-methyltransferase (adenine-specific)
MDSKKYQVVYADPPWHYERQIDKVIKSPSSRVDAKSVYPTMKKDAIAALPIASLTDKDAACFMWTTDHHLPEAMEILKAWGFTYKTIGFVWVKKEKSGKQVRMMAPWTNKGAEICLLGTRGAMTKHMKANNVSQVVEATRAGHSKKPDFIAEEIVRMFPDCARIELFARDAKPGWDVWGNEITNTIEI